MIRRAAHRTTALLAIVFVVIVLAGILPVGPVAYRLLVVTEEPRRADAIVVLGGGIVDDNLLGLQTTARLVYGLRLLHHGYAPLVILTGANPVKPQVPESVVMRRVAEDIGAAPQVLVVETDGERTATQGAAVARLARSRGIRRILLVTSAEHSYRASRVFRRTGLEVISTPVVPQRPPRLSIAVHPLDVTDRLVDLVPVLYESGAIVMYWWRGWL